MKSYDACCLRATLRCLTLQFLADLVCEPLDSEALPLLYRVRLGPRVDPKPWDFLPTADVILWRPGRAVCLAPCSVASLVRLAYFPLFDQSIGRRGENKLDELNWPHCREPGRQLYLVATISHPLWGGSPRA